MNRQRNSWTAFFLRMVQAILCAILLVGIASAANFLTTAPKAVSLIFEPLSLFLVPGLVASVFVTGPHDYSPALVAEVSLAFYTLAFYLLLRLRRRRTSP